MQGLTEIFLVFSPTNAGKALAKLVTDDETLRNLAINDVLSRGYLQDFFGEDGKKADAKTVADGVAKLIERESAGEVLTEAEQDALDEYRAEVAAFAEQRLLGNKDFMKKLITTEPTTAEKLIGKIREMCEKFKVRKDPEAKAQLELYRKAEKLFFKGLEEAGGTMDVNGKIHLANDEEDEGASGEKKKVRRLMAGEHAKTADKTKLATAQKMITDGADSETVRRETGWYKGYDGKWRFEIDDSDIEIAFNGRLSRDPDIRRYAELVEKVYFLASATVEEQSELADLDKKIGKKSIAPDKLGDMIKHPALFEAYPQLADLDVYFAEGTNDASYHPGFKEIALPKRLKMDPKKFKKTLIHEIQHAVQDIEGFASGSNVAMFNNTAERSAYDQYQSTAGEIEARDAANRADLTAEQRKNTRPDIDRSDMVFADSDVSLSIGESKDGTPVVVVNDDITKYASNDAGLVKLVKERIAKLPYVVLGKQKIQFTRDTKKEVTYSNHTKWLRKNAPDVYKDKMRSFNHPNEIILATTNYINEGLHHPRKDDIIDFARGEVLLDVLGQKYSAEVVIGFTQKGVCELHDLMNMKPVTFDYKKRDALSTISSNDEHLQKRSSLDNSISQNSEKSTPSAQEFSDKIRHSRKATGDTVQLSKGELAKLHANYAGDKVFAKGAVTEALKGIDALKVLPAERRREIANEIWTGYNKRLHQQGFETFTELKWNQLHAEILQEAAFEMTEDEVRKMDEQIVAALEQIVTSGKPSIKAKLESDTSTEGYRKQAKFWREEHGRAVERNKRLNELKYEPFHHLRWWFICAEAAIKTPPTAPTGSCRGLCF